MPEDPNPEGRALEGARIEANHPSFGTLTIERQAKATHDREIRFDLSFDRGGGSSPVTAMQKIYVDNHDPEVGGKSSAG